MKTPGGVSTCLCGRRPFADTCGHARRRAGGSLPALPVVLILAGRGSTGGTCPPWARNSRSVMPATWSCPRWHRRTGKVLRSRIMLVGLGGLNSPAALYLAAAGVGTLGLVDLDRVERSNLQRQIIHGEKSIGHRKTNSARDRIRDLNPNTQTVVPQRMTPTMPMAGTAWDMIVDGTDNYPSRYALNEACVQARKPLVYGAVMSFQGQVSVFWPAGKPGKAPCLHCLMPEPPTRSKRRPAPKPACSA